MTSSAFVGIQYCTEFCLSCVSKLDYAPAFFQRELATLASLARQSEACMEETERQTLQKTVKQKEKKRAL